MSSSDAFRDRYGEWALVAGASEGVGEQFAREMAKRGVNVVLVSRRQAVLDALAEDIEATTGVETRAAAVDLSLPDAAARVAEIAAGLDVGMLIYCAGADPDYTQFLAKPIEAALGLVHRNCVVPMQLCHHFAQAMVDRGRGGIILLSSGAGLAGGMNMVAYSASKAFDMVMGEALWAELQGAGVDVLSLVLGPTDTPALRRLLLDMGVMADINDELPVPDAATPQQVVDEGLAHLRAGPTHLVGEALRESARQLRSMTRSEAARSMMSMQADSFMAGEDADAPTPASG